MTPLDKLRGLKSRSFHDPLRSPFVSIRYLLLSKRTTYVVIISAVNSAVKFFTVKANLGPFSTEKEVTLLCEGQW